LAFVQQADDFFDHDDTILYGDTGGCNKPDRSRNGKMQDGERQAGKAANQGERGDQQNDGGRAQ